MAFGPTVAPAWHAGHMRVALVQLDLSLDAPYDERVARVVDLVRAQRGADLVLLPELWAHGAFAAERWDGTAEPVPGPTVSALCTAARDVGAYVHMGSVLERAPDGRMHNTGVLLDRSGAVAATYRKVHLFGFSEGEATRLTAGPEAVVHSGGDLGGSVGLATCYDLRFPELFRAMVDRSAVAVSLVSCWPVARVAHWSLLARARAVEDQMYVFACNGVGSHSGVTAGGRSVVVDPWGEVLAEASADTEEVLTVEVDLASVEDTRRRFPVLPDRRLR